MKKILMFQDYFNNGGIEKIILDISSNINKYYKVDILSMVNRSDKDIISLLDKDYKKLYKRCLLGLLKYKRYLKTTQYDVIHIHCYNAFGLVYAHIAKKYCKRILLHAHNSDIDSDFLYIKHTINNILKILFKSKKYTYLAVSDECNKFCFNSKNVIILPNAVDYNKYYFNENKRKDYRKKYGYKNNEIVIGHVGRFNSQKNHEFIIDIFNEICKKSNKYRLFLVGDGILKDKIIKRINMYNLDSKVTMLTKSDDIPNLINMFDIFLFPSIYEGFGIVVVENQVNGKYVFVSDRVPDSVKISSRITTLSLSNDATYWADKLLNIEEKPLCLDKELDLDAYIKKIIDIYQ